MQLYKLYNTSNPTEKTKKGSLFISTMVLDKQERKRIPKNPKIGTLSTFPPITSRKRC
jgi:hypothetical protein